MKTWALLSFTACGMGLFLSGCGGGSVPPAPVSPLAGNWLIVGPMPANEFGSTGFRLAMTFDVAGNNVVAGAFGSNFCDNVQSGFQFGSIVAASGSLAENGSFNLATPANIPLETLSIKGTAPRTSMISKVKEKARISVPRSEGAG